MLFEKEANSYPFCSLLSVGSAYALTVIVISQGWYAK